MIRFTKSIRFKLLIVAMLVSVISLALLLSVSNYVIKPAFANLESEKAKVELCVLQKALENKILQIAILCNDWGDWDDACDFIEEQDQDFIDSNLKMEAFSTTNMNLIYLYNKEGKPIFAKCYDWDTQEEIDLNKMAGKADFLPGELVHDENDVDKVKYNLIRVGQEHILTVSRPVRHSGTLDIFGTIIMGVFVNESFFEDVKAGAGSDFQVAMDLNPEELQGFTRVNYDKFRLFDSYNYKFSQNGKDRFISTIIYDYQNAPAFLLTRKIDGQIVSLGNSATIYLFLTISASALILFISMTILTKKIVFGPLNTMVREIENIQVCHDLSIRESLLRKDELGYLAAQFNALLGDIRVKTKQLEIMATTDSMTGILNHKTIIDKLDLEISRCQRYHNDLAIAVIDIDYFKQINDHFGHQAGDEVIKTIVSTINGLIRDTDLFGRYGGDEFLLVLIDQNKDKALMVMERIYQAVRSINWHDQDMKVTLSSGVAEISANIHDSSAFIESADNSLYQAKANGRNCFVMA